MHKPIIYPLIVALLGLRVLELRAGLPLVWHYIVLIALSVGMYSLVFAWFWVERSLEKPAAERQPVMMPQRTKRRY